VLQFPHAAKGGIADLLCIQINADFRIWPGTYDVHVWLLDATPDGAVQQGNRPPTALNFYIGYPRSRVQYLHPWIGPGGKVETIWPARVIQQPLNLVRGVWSDVFISRTHFRQQHCRVVIYVGVGAALGCFAFGGLRLVKR
jgi:hypothetical protein